MVICKDKTKLDINKCRDRLKLVSSKKYKWSREYPYYDLKPRIICEKFISTKDDELSDYKFFCFNGEPKYLFVGTGRQKIGQEVKFDFFDTEFNHLPIRNGHDNSSSVIEKPTNFEDMLELARKLSHGIPHVRVDLYNADGKIYFGEMTFFHFGGLVPFEPYEWDMRIGKMLTL